MNTTLSGRIAIVTGASSGIGRATARLLAAQGVRVVLGARRQAELDLLTREIVAGGGSAVAVAGDVRDERYAQQLVDVAKDEWGGLDIAINNAGMQGPATPVTEVETDAWRFEIDTNLTAAFFAARAQVPAMLERGRGSLVFTSSFVGVTVAFPGFAPYAASKAGLLGLVKTLAVELGGDGIRVNALLPGGTETAMLDGFATTDEAKAAVGGLMALGRMAKAEEIAQAAVFLASDAASFVTGSSMFVDGGVSITH